MYIYYLKTLRNGNVLFLYHFSVSKADMFQAILQLEINKWITRHIWYLVLMKLTLCWSLYHTHFNTRCWQKVRPRFKRYALLTLHIHVPNTSVPFCREFYRKRLKRRTYKMTAETKTFSVLLFVSSALYCDEAVELRAE